MTTNSLAEAITERLHSQDNNLVQTIFMNTQVSDQFHQALRDYANSNDFTRGMINEDDGDYTWELVSQAPEVPMTREEEIRNVVI